MTGSTRIFKNLATRGPIRYLKMAKCVQKLPMSAIFGHIFVIIRYLEGPLVEELLHILVEQVISFKMSGQISKSDKY